MHGMHTNRHRVGPSYCVKALSKGKYGSSLIGMDACQNDRFLEQGMEVPENISPAIPEWFSFKGTGSSARHQSHPDAAFVHSILGRQAHFDPSKIPPQDRDIHLVSTNSALIPTRLNPFPTLEAATAQHAINIIRIKTRNSRNPKKQQSDLAHHLSWCGRHYL
eukprot:1161259-Pelagomonas_calceolata.AAC.2